MNRPGKSMSAGRPKNGLGALALATGLVASMGQKCPRIIGTSTSSSALEGTWKGQVTTSGSFSVPNAGTFSIGAMTGDLELTINADGLPTSFPLHALAQAQTAAQQPSTSLFTPGQGETKTQTIDLSANGTSAQVVIQSTVTVRESSRTDTGFHVIYDYAMTATFSGGFSDFTQEFTGSETYDVQLNGDTLHQNNEAAFDSTASGVTAHYVFNYTADLTRQ